MKQKKLISILILMTMLMTGILTACGTTDSTETTADAESSDVTGTTGAAGGLKIGLSMSNRDQWLSTMEQAAIAKAEELGITLNSFDANTDVVTQLSHVTACANDGYDAMIINLVNTDNAQEMIDAAGDMPIVFVNRTPSSADDLLQADKVVYVGSDEEEAGQLEGTYISELLEEEGKKDANIVIMTGTLGMQATTKRTEAAKRALEESSLNVTYVFEDTAEWDRSKAMEKFTQFLGTGQEYDAVICNNDEMALGVVEAMLTTGDGTITAPVAGVDATDSALQSIKDGNQAFSAYQNAAGQGEGAIEAAAKIAGGEACEIYTWVPFEPVDASNVDEYLN